jgi:predicted small secreted protein
MLRRTQFFKRVGLALVAGSMALTAAACNTVKGAGQDLQSVSETTEEAIN